MTLPGPVAPPLRRLAAKGTSRLRLVRDFRALTRFTCSTESARPETRHLPSGAGGVLACGRGIFSNRSLEHRPGRRAFSQARASSAAVTPQGRRGRRLPCRKFPTAGRQAPSRLSQLNVSIDTHFYPFVRYEIQPRSSTNRMFRRPRASHPLSRSPMPRGSLKPFDLQNC